jgi:hypothetical protein
MPERQQSITYFHTGFYQGVATTDFAHQPAFASIALNMPLDAQTNFIAVLAFNSGFSASSQSKATWYLVAECSRIA